MMTKQFDHEVVQQANLSSYFYEGSLTFLANPTNFKNLMTCQVISNSWGLSPCLAENSKAWWLLCHPSPQAKSATHQLLRDKSPVLQVWYPHKCAAEFTNQVEWCNQAIRKAPPHTKAGNPPIRQKKTS
eukprot:TRINITY_DN1196_c0_g1_i1.p4 TRINITY_DN1196_c0_g1~~TRINITY_DN1196_c0_g1_i1.p4  ORF type:complete len:129 (+),score=14.48 TRINITY_DN1196_c0_g1_i1:1099-1485(+)